MEDQKALKTSALVSEFANAIEHQVDDLFADRVVAASVVVGGVLLAGDELLGMEELPVSAGSDLIDDGRLEIDEDSSWHVLASPSFGEEGVEGVVSAADGLVGRHLTVRLDAVLEAVKLPASVTYKITRENLIL